MGNIEWFSFKRNVSDEELTEKLREVANELWKDAVLVETDPEWGHWFCEIRADLVKDYKLYHSHLFNIHREGPRKFGGKMGSGIGRWIQLTLTEGAASRLGHSTFSNEGISETWKPEPLKYENYEDYMRKMSPFSLMKKGEVRSGWDHHIRETLSCLPQELTLVNHREED